jgi:hypothetical protein
MNIKLGKFEANIPLSALIIVGLVADNAIANVCKKKAYDTYAEKVIEVANSSKVEES